jgi:hypothetical protein
MRRTYPLIRSALVPAAVLMTVSGSTVAVAATPDRPASVRSSEYTMLLSPASATVRHGRVTKTVISFDAKPYLHGSRVDLSISGLPAGATASFSPARPLVTGHSTLTLRTASSTPAGAVMVTVSAIINLTSSDPIGTTTPFGLTVR